METLKNHHFHLVDQRPWPIIASIIIIGLIIGIIKWFHTYNSILLIIIIIRSIIIRFQWWRDISRERTIQGLHTYIVTLGIRWGIILFITSEVFFFIRFFWAYFHRRLSPSIEINLNWPPNNIIPFNPIQIPLLNTLILLSSGITVTWAHHSLIENNYQQIYNRLLITIILGIYFTFLQIFEYLEAPFSISDSIFGSRFFIATGFHGLHVIIGTTFLFICLIRHYNNHFSNIHHFGFEAAAWYWHFVDVVWLFLYISIYWWGNYLFSIKITFNFQLKNLKKNR